MTKISQREEIDFLSKGIPSLEDPEIPDKLLKKLESNNPHYLIHLYTTQLNYKKALRLIQKFLKRGAKYPHYVEQIFYTCVMFEDWKLLESNMVVYNTWMYKELIRFRILYKLKNIIVQDTKVIGYNNKTDVVYNKILVDDYNFTYIDLDYNMNCNIMNLKLDKTYNLICKTPELEEILNEHKDFLSEYFDINILFLYFYISTVGCIRNNCNKICNENKESIRRILTEDEYLNKLGEKEKSFIILFFNERFIRRDNLVNRVINIIEELEPVKFKYELKYEDLCNQKNEYFSPPKFNNRGPLGVRQYFDNNNIYPYII